MRLLLTTIDNNCIQTKLALKYLYGVLADSPAEVEAIEFREEDSDKAIYDKIVCSRYNIIYFHCNMMNEDRINTLCEVVKMAMPTSIIVVGGMQVSFDTGEYLKRNPMVDFAVRGEAEQVMFNFIKTIVTYEFDFGGIAGLAYRHNDEICVNAYEAPIKFEDIPFPYERFDVDPEGVAYYESFRGSVDRCTYSQFLPDRKIRSLSLSRVCSEMRYFLIKNVREVRFVEKWFNYSAERAYRIWEYIINNDNGITKFRFDIDGDMLDDETIRLLSRARKGLFEFDVDVESTNAETLDAVGRKANIYQLMYNLSKLLQEGTVYVNVYLRLGLPFDTPRLFERAFDKVYGLGATTFNIEVLKMKKGTVLRENASKYGYLYSSRAPYEVVSNDFMKAADFIRIRMIARLAAIYSCGGFNDSIAKIASDLNLKPFGLFAGIYDYVSDNALYDKLDKKENLYRTLYAFATSAYDSESETLQLPLLMQILHSDMENTLSDEELRQFDSKGWAFTNKAQDVISRY